MNEIRKYFSIRELVSKRVWNKCGDAAWSFFDPRLFDVVVWLRKGLGIPLVCNNWANGGSLEQRGFRCNLDGLVKDKTDAGKLYCSAHIRGQAIDLSSGKMSAKQIRTWIRVHAAQCPHPIRLESDKSAPTWVHIDVCNISGQKIVEFDA